MNSPFKFLRRVRIHGGECGAVARALHHEAQKVALTQAEQSLISDEKALLRQADLKKSFGSTFIERKQMSTKTTFKRVALVAVAALGLGVLSSVAPANAVVGQTAASIVVGDIPAVRVGATAYVPVKIFLSSAAVATDTITIAAKITSAPILGGVANVASNLGAVSTGDANNNTGQKVAVVKNVAGQDYVTTTAAAAVVHGRATSVSDNTITASSATGGMSSVVNNYILTSADITAGYHTAYIKVVPDVVGAYSVLVSTNATGTNKFTAGDANTTFTITTGTAPTAVALTTLGGGTITGGSPIGNAILVSLVGGSLAGDESIVLTPSGTGNISDGANSIALTPDGFAGAATAVALTSADFISGKKIIWLTSAGTAAETISLTATGSSGISSSVSTTKTYSVVKGAGAATVTVLTLEAPSADAVYAMTNATISGNDITVSTSSTSQKIGFTTPANMTAQKGWYKVTDNAGTLSGVAGLEYNVSTSFSATTAASGGAFSFAASGVGKPAATILFTVVIPIGAAGNMGLLAEGTRVFKTAAPTNSTFTVTPNDNFIAAPAAAIALTATLEDQFGSALANVAVTVTTTGRNNPAATALVTNADGEVTFTTADSSVSTTSLVDTVTFSATGATAKSVTINYGNTAVGTVTVSGGNTTASVNALVNTVNGISVGSATTGVEAGAIAITATVKDANANALAGIAVNFTVVGTTVAFKSTSATVYTGADGTAAGSLYAWAAGTYTYTVTAGGKTTTGTATFGSIAAGNARVISATVAGNVVTGKAVDRLGNPVRNVPLYAVVTGGANIAGGFVATGTTAADGTLSFVVTGSGDVTVTAVNPSDPAGTTAHQTAHLAGNATLATATVAAKAYGATTVGTATTAETNVGASFAPAGVASVIVSVVGDTGALDAANAATDAAAEAIDAANAATDAANLAAEAADAATVAAEEARDAADAATAAVEELATQVATLMAALKAQITTLANTVAKIAKKVKA